MTATNINIAEFIHVLQTLKADGSVLIDLDMLQDPDHPSMNKLVIHPVPAEGRVGSPAESQEVKARNPQINRDNNDIFSAFNL